MAHVTTVVPHRTSFTSCEQPILTHAGLTA